jgi:hypothetical protein
MSRSSLHRRMAVLLVTSVLAAPLSASPSSTRSHSPRSAAGTSQTPSGLIANLWESLVHIWSAEGCMIDPYGRCAPNPAGSGALVQPPHLAEGCTGDPYGRCTPSPAGSGVTAQPQPTADAGCGADPYGSCNTIQ